MTLSYYLSNEDELNCKDNDYKCPPHCQSFMKVNPTALRKAKIVCNFGLSECNRVKIWGLKKEGVGWDRCNFINIAW